MARELILDGQVLGLHQRGLVVILAPVEANAHDNWRIRVWRVGLCSTAGFWKLKLLKEFSMVAGACGLPTRSG